MSLLASVLYDPAVAVSKVTDAHIAMTPLDTTNLRLSFVVPAHGSVRIRMQCVAHGSTSVPMVLLGVMSGSTVVARQPANAVGIAVATWPQRLLAEFVISGLTPGPVVWDAAYGVEVAIASTAIKYGGPNDTTTNNAFGGFAFEAWDPSPNYGNSPTDFRGNGCC